MVNVNLVVNKEYQVFKSYSRLNPPLLLYTSHADVSHLTLIVG